MYVYMYMIICTYMQEYDIDIENICKDIYIYLLRYDIRIYTCIEAAGNEDAKRSVRVFTLS